MVKLKNLKRNNNLVACDLYIEDSADPQHFVVDIATKEVVEFSAPKDYPHCENHVAHAQWKIIALANQGELPSEYTIMWY